MPSQKTIKRIVAFARKLDGVDPLVLREGLEIAHLHHQIEQVIENYLSSWGLTMRQVEILESLYHNADGSMTPAALSEEVGLTRSAMTSALDTLETLGHVVRTPHPTDRRMVALCLTPSGRDFISQRLPERYQQFHRIMTGLTKKERTIHLQIYRKVFDLLVHDMAETRKQALGSGRLDVSAAERP
jgi:DNA-binding MarR family transcriptional regulator